MQRNLWNDLTEYVKNNRFRSVWRRVVQVLACVVVFCTTYALILPAITMEQKSYCGYEEHVHTEDCYQQIPVASELICHLVEGEAVPELLTVSDGDSAVLENSEEMLQPHTHTEDCYRVPKESPLTCEVAESEEHQHEFLCYGSWELICAKEEHTHDLGCFADTQADVESHSVWENMVANMDLTGIWAEDVVTIAKSQLGYTESARNYIVNEDTTVNGYTRYGAWAEEPYGDWDAMFASFCLYYAGVEGMPLGADSGTWVQELALAKLYRLAADWEPQPGNLLFADEDMDGALDQVAVVSEYIQATEEVAAQIKTVQGDVSDQVQYVTYEMGDERIHGYGILPKQPDPTLLYTYSDHNVQVEVKLPEGTRVPKDAVLSVRPIYAESEGYDQLLNQAEAAIDGMVERIQFYDISFYTPKQEYIPVSDRAQVTMRFADKVVDSTEDTVVLHYDENGNAPVVLDNVNIDEQTSFVAGKLDVSGTVVSALQDTSAEATNTVVTFATDGFSVFAVVEVGSGKYEAQVLNDMTGIYFKLDTDRIYMIITNSDIDQNGDTDTRVALKAQAGNYGELKGVEVVNTNYAGVTNNDQYRGMVTADADNGLLWRFSQHTLYDADSSGNRIGTFTIQSVSTGQYLAIGQGGELVLSNDRYEFKGTYSANNTTRLGNMNEVSIIPFRNQDGSYVFKTTYNINDFQNGGVLLAEYNGPVIQPEAKDRVTDLDGKIMMIVAVNNDSYTQDGTYYDYPAKAMSSKSYSEGGREHALEATPMTELRWSQDGKIEIVGEDSANNLAWEFEEVPNKPGFYYIKAANVYGDYNPNQGKYIYFVNEGDGNSRVRDLRLGTYDQRQEIEVVKYTVEDSNYQVKEVVCLRTTLNGNYYYLQLGRNHSNWPIYNSDQHYANDNQNSNNISYPGNHFVLAELSDSDPDGAVVNKINDMIDQLPTSMEEFERWVAEKNNFASQIEYRKELQEIARTLKAYYDEKKNSLSNMQKNFIGETRMEKLDNLANNLGFLLKENPKVVPAAEPNATVKLFNYSSAINNNFTLSQDKIFQFYSWDDAQKTVDGYVMDGNITTRPPVMDSTLENGYPKIIGYYPEGAQTYTPVNNGSLADLFSDAYLVNKDGEAMSNGGGLFRQDEDGYYYYFSDTNAAWYDETQNKFVLYDVVVRPEYALDRNGLDNDMISNFLPFNEVIDNVIYDNRWSDSKVGEDTQTAYLNSKTDLWFGMTIEYDFFIPKDAQVYTEENGMETPQEMIFEFHGDDDVFVYIDDVLVLDIGGTHGARDGKINFTTGEVTYQTSFQDRENDIYRVEDVTTNLATLFKNANVDADFDQENPNRFADYTMHNLKFFYLERGGTYSYAGIRFNMPTIPENSLMVGKELHKEDNQEIIDAELDYTFRIVNAKDTEKSFVDAEAPSYMIYEGGQYINTAYVDEKGYFTLKAGQRALFPGLLDPARGGNEFYVQEIMPPNVDGQYNVVYYDSEGSITTKVPLRSTKDDTVIYQTKKYTTDESSLDYTETVIFVNDVSGKELDKLNITKVAGDGDTIDPADKKFEIKVQVGNDQGDLIPLPAGTEYTVTKDGSERQKTVSNDGIIPLSVGETATIKGFLAGTYWTIEEILAVGEHFTPVYNGEALKGTIDESRKAGTFGVEDVISFTVTNYPCDFILNLDIEKQAIGNTGNANFNFNVEEGTWTSDKVWSGTKTLDSTNVFVKDSAPATGKVVLGFHNSDKSPCYYRISEQRGTGEFIYDDTFYIVEVTITGEDDNKSAYVSKIWKNGTEELSTSSLPLSFVNYKSTTLTVNKTVVNASNANDTNGTFPFKVTITLDGKAFTNIPAPENCGYTVNNGVVTFDLKHEGSVTIPIPFNATVTVEETNNAGYKTSYQVVQGETTSATQSGTQTTIQDVASPTTVHFTNQTGYELPATGGSGTHLYLLGGLLLVLTAAGLLCFKKRGLS